MGGWPDFGRQDFKTLSCLRYGLLKVVQTTISSLLPMLGEVFTRSRASSMGVTWVSHGAARGESPALLVLNFL